MYHLQKLGLICCLLCTLPAYTQGSSSVSTGTIVFKLLEKESFRIYFYDFDRDAINHLADITQAHLEELAINWRVRFPQERVEIIIDRVGHRKTYPGTKFYCTYEAQRRSIIVYLDRPEDIDKQQFLVAFKTALTRRMLHLHNKNVLPHFLEIGLAQYFSGAKAPRFDAIFGFRETEDLVPLLMNAEQIRRPWESPGKWAISLLFAKWWWEQENDALPFLQQFLSGTSWQKSLGKRDLPSRIQLFDVAVRFDFRLADVWMTGPFWGMLGAALVILAFLSALLHALWSARIPFVDMDDLEEGPTPAILVPKESNRVGPQKRRRPSLPPRPNLPGRPAFQEELALQAEKTSKPQSEPSRPQELDFIDLDFEEEPPVQTQAPSRPKKPSPPKPRQATPAVPKALHEHAQRARANQQRPLDQDSATDNFFDGDLSEALDDVFDQLEGKGD